MLLLFLFLAWRKGIRAQSGPRLDEKEHNIGELRRKPDINDAVVVCVLNRALEKATSVNVSAELVTKIPPGFCQNLSPNFLRHFLVDLGCKAMILRSRAKTVLACGSSLLDGEN